jgi:hypothetical protein
MGNELELWGKWTLDTLRVYLIALLEEKFYSLIRSQEAMGRALEAKLEEQKESVQIALVAQKEQVSQALASADRAVTKAETASEKRFEAVNEFRNTLADQQRNLMPRQEITVIVAAMEGKIQVIKDALDGKIGIIQQTLLKLEGRRSGISEGWGWAIGIIGLIVAIISIAAFILKT